jgi:lipoprotein-releasing system permease protein
LQRASPAKFSYAFYIGLRYSFSRKRNRFTSVIAAVSMLGMVLGVASLVTVLSIMNGFSSELRGRILALVPHGFVEPLVGELGDWRDLRQTLLQQPGVQAVSPYISDKVILSGPQRLRGAVLTAIDTVLEPQVSDVAAAMTPDALAELSAQRFTVVLGEALARSLGVVYGDHVDVTVPRLTVTPLGVFPRNKRLVVVGTFAVGAQQDSFQAYVSLETGQKLFSSGENVTGLQVKTEDLFSAPQIMRALGDVTPTDMSIKNWSETQGSLFQAVKMEKIMVSVLLLCVVAVAAFNIVSTLVMSVAEKRSDIAVLRTMGARAGDILLIFIAHGLGLALAGISGGLLIGITLATYISPLTLFIENLIGVKLFDPSVYFISELPSQLMWSDVAVVALASLVLSLLATVYPAWRASQIAPAEVLRYE